MRKKTKSLLMMTALCAGFAMPALADIDKKPVPFDAQKFAEQVAVSKAQDKAILNIKTLSELEPAVGNPDPEPYYILPSDTGAQQSSAPQETTAQEPPAVPAASVSDVAFLNVPAADMPITATQESLSAGAKIKITVTGEDDLSAVYPIKADGTIDFPMLGKLKLSGLSKAQAQELVTARLKDGYLVDPQVSVEAIKLDPIFVLGDVAKPGSSIYSDQISIASAIQSAGGLGQNGQIKSFQILRTTSPSMTGLYNVQNDNEMLQAGDILIVKGF